MGHTACVSPPSQQLHTHSEMKALTVLLLCLLVLTVTSRRDSFDDNKPFNKNNPRMATENCNIRGEEDDLSCRRSYPGQARHARHRPGGRGAGVGRLQDGQQLGSGVSCLTCEELCLVL